MKSFQVNTLLISLAFSSNVFASDNDELLNQVRLGHRAARQSIRNLSCDYIVQEIQPSKNVMAFGKYARFGDVVRIRDGNEGISTEDMLIRGGQCKRVGRAWSNGKVEYFAVLQSGVQFFSWGDVWQRMLIDHSSPDGDHCNYDMAVDRIAANAQLSRERLAGRDCVKIEVQEKTKLGFTKVLKIWHDIKNNYLIRKLEAYDLSDPKDRNTVEVTEFLEIAPGSIVPIACRTDSYRNDRLTTSFETKLTEIRLNQPLTESDLALPPIPKGTRLQDTLHGTIGPVGSDWKPLGAMAAMPKVTLAPAAGASSAGNDINSERRRTTDSEPQSANRYLLYGSILLLAVCVVIFVLRRNRAKGNRVSNPA